MSEVDHITDSKIERLRRVEKNYRAMLRFARLGGVMLRAWPEYKAMPPSGKAIYRRSAIDAVRAALRQHDQRRGK